MPFHFDRYHPTVDFAYGGLPGEVRVGFWDSTDGPLEVTIEVNGQVQEHHQDLMLDGNFYRTLWHEIGHYLGPARDRRGRDLDQALGRQVALQPPVRLPA